MRHPYARLRIRQLQMLRDIADCGGIRQACDRLHLSAAAVSKSLREIEHAMGFPIFVRSSRGMSVTPQGERVIVHARLLLNEMALMGEQLQEQPPDARSTLRLGASPYVVSCVLPLLLARLPGSPRQPGSGCRFSTQVTEGFLSGMVEMLVVGRLDAVISLYTVGDLAGINTAALAIHPLRDERMAVLVSPHLRLSARRRYTWAALASQPRILPATGIRLRRVVDSMFERQGLQPPAPAIEGGSLQGSVGLCLAGLGVTVAPQALVEHHLKSGALREVSVGEQLPSSSLALMYRRISAGYLSGLMALRGAAHDVFG